MASSILRRMALLLDPRATEQIKCSKVSQWNNILPKQDHWEFKLHILIVSPVILTMPYALVILTAWDSGTSMP